VGLHVALLIDEGCHAHSKLLHNPTGLVSYKYRHAGLGPALRECLPLPPSAGRTCSPSQARVPVGWVSVGEAWAAENRWSTREESWIWDWRGGKTNQMEEEGAFVGLQRGARVQQRGTATMFILGGYHRCCTQLLDELLGHQSVSQLAYSVLNEKKAMRLQKGHVVVHGGFQDKEKEARVKARRTFLSAL